MNADVIMFRKVLLASIFYASISYASLEDYDLAFMEGNLSKSHPSYRFVSFGVSLGYNKVDVVLNNDAKMTSLNVDFLDNDGNIEPCFNADQLHKLGVKANADNWRKNYCFLVKDISEDAFYRFDGSKLLLNLYVPRVNLLRKKYQTMTSPELWESGINSLKFNYNSYASVNDDDEIEGYVGANAILSLGQWRIKQSGSLYKSDNYHQSTVGSLYAYTDLDPILAQLSVGQINSTSGMAVNSSIPITGLKINTSDMMLNPKWNLYSPTIRGRVNSASARVSIIDRKRVVFSEVLSTGEFEIKDFDVSSVGSELMLVVEESDGTIRSRDIPYTKLPDMLKNETYKYSFAIGQYRNENTAITPTLLSGRLQYGFKAFTSELDMLLSENYQYIEAGSVFDLGRIGAVSVGGGVSFTENEFGYLLHTSYAQYINSTNTSVQFMGTQYRSKKFNSFEDYINSRNLNEKIKNTYDISINQPIFDTSLSVGYRKQTYHESKSNNNSSFYASTSFMLGKSSITINVAKEDSLSLNDEDEISYGLNVTVPLDIIENSQVSSFFTQRESSSYNTLSFNKNSKMSNYNLSIQSDFSNEKISNSYSAEVQKTTTFADLGARINWDNDSHKFTLTSKGAGVFYRNGLLLSPYINETSAIIELGEGAEDVLINEQHMTNSQGSAIISYSRPYKVNNVDLDTSFSENTDITEAPSGYVPRKGSTILIKMDANVGMRKLVKINSEEDLFGTPVFDYKTQNQVTYIGMDNILYLSGLKKNGVHLFSIGSGDSRCDFELNMDDLSHSINDLAYVECKG